MVKRAIHATCLSLFVSALFILSAYAAVLDDTFTGCNASVYVQPEAAVVYGTEVGRSLAAVSLITGIQFTESATSEGADLVYAVGDTTVAGASAVAYYMDGRVTLPPAWVKNYEGQKPRHVGNARWRVVLHETLHWLGLGHDEWWGSVMYPYVTDLKPTLSDADLANMRLIAGRNGCINVSD